MYWRPGRDEEIYEGQDILRGLSNNPPAEERLLKWLCEESRSRAHQLQRSTCRNTPHKFKGVFSGKPNWRKTIWSRTRGQSSLYLNRGGREKYNKPCQDCAIVFILNESFSDLRKPIADYWCDERPANQRNIYSNFIWVRDRTIRKGIYENKVVLRVRLYQKLSPTYDKETTYKFLDNLPQNKLCTSKPWEDPELKIYHDQPVSLALTAAIKWTIGDHITVVASHSILIGAAVTRFAADRGVRLIHLSTYQFRDPLIFERFSIDSEVPVYNQWSPPDPSLVSRCRSVPGFDDM
jgi:hypothetical protein